MAVVDEALEKIKAPPHSNEAEQSVLGGLMLDNGAWEQVSELLSDEDFYNPKNRLIYRMITKLMEQEMPIDVITISEELDKINELDKAGGTHYLADMAMHTPSAANIRAYAQIVHEHSLRRQMIHAATEIAEGAYNTEGRSAEELLGEAEKSIVDISEGKAKEGGLEKVSSVLSKTIDKIDELFNTPDGLTGVTTGFTDLDKLTSGMQKADMIIVAGRPSMGKTTFSMNLVENALLGQDDCVLVFSMEMPSDSIVMRMLSSLGRINQGKVRSGKLEEEDWPKLTAAVGLLKDRKLFIDDTPNLSPNEMRNRIRKIEREHGKIGLVMVDYLQLMKGNTNTQDRNLMIGEISRGLKAIAKEFECPMIALSQLNRSLEQRPNKRPVMSDLRESGAIEQDADIIAFIYRDEVYNEDSPDKGIGEIIIGKHRNGALGTVRLAFIGQYTRFENLSQEYYDQHGPFDDE